MVQRKLTALTAGSPWQAIVAPRDVAYAIVALYLGIDMLSQLDGDRERAASPLDLGVRYAPVIGALLPSQHPGGRG